MRKIAAVFSCAGLNFRKWRVTPRLYVVAAVTLVQMLWCWIPLMQYSLSLGVPVTPWGFGFMYGHPTMLMTNSCLLLLLFCNAPFSDTHTPFVVIRTGRRNWMVGQLVYIAAASLLYVLYQFGLMLLILSPSLGFSWSWGSVLWQIAFSGYDPAYTGSLGPVKEVITQYSGLAYTLLSMLIMWLAGMLMGCLVLCFNLLSGRSLGVAISGVFCFLSYFCQYVGYTLFGGRIFWLTPMAWVYPPILQGGRYPTVQQAILVLTVLIVGLAGLSVWACCRKDLVLQKGEV